jgi:RNA polymerase-binding transcription factor DksA
VDASAARDRLEALRATTLERLDALHREHSAVVDASRDSNADDEHDPEGATIAFERAQLSALLDAARARLEDVQRALDRLAAGEDGRCERCGGPIGAERLQARPAARDCIDCARADRWPRS